jgi:ribonuclease D
MRKTGPSKAETDLLPPFAGMPPACIHVPATPAAFAAAAADIRAARQVGFDTESKPTFAVGEVSRGPHVAQFALPDKAYVFQLHHEHALPVLAELLQDREVLKIGFGLSADRSQIHARLGITLRAVLDLDHVFRKQGYGSSLGARAAVGLLLGRNFRKSKRTTTSNWSSQRLTDIQMLYAANDAYAALKVFEALGLPSHALPVGGLDD